MLFFMMGGFPMFLITLFGLLGVGGAARYAWAPGPGRLPHLLALSGVILVGGMGGLAVDLMTVFTKVPGDPALSQSPELPLILLVGIGESLAPVVLAAGFLIAQGLLIALGLRRAQG